MKQNINLNKTVSEIIETKKCCGCGNCSIICPSKAITMDLNREGFLFPTINKKFCTNCGACLRKCPINCSAHYSLGEHNITAYVGYIKNEQLLLESSSGGLGFSLLKLGIENHYHTFAVKYSDDFKSVVYGEVIEPHDLKDYRGTKYVQSHKNNTFKAIKEYLNNGEKCLFIGLPCDIGALKAFVGDQQNLFTVELICHGATSEKALYEFISSKERKKASIINFNMRYKKNGWAPSYIKIDYSDGKSYYKLFDSTTFGFAFRNFSRPSCYSCVFKGDSKCADLTIGDFWGATPKHECWNKNGVSVCLAHNEKGLHLFNSIKNDFIFSEIDYENAIKANPLVNKSRSIGIRDKYSEAFVKNGISFARRKNEAIIDFLKRKLRNVKYFFKR